MEERTGESSDMDAVLAYRHYLAAEDHLDELLFRANDPQEKLALQAMLEITVSLRDEIMPPEANPEKHCLVKHYAVAYEALRERWKTDQSATRYWQKKQAYDLLIDALEMLWGRKIILCERCDYEHIKDTGSSGRSSVTGTRDGQPGELIQTVSSSGGVSV